MYPLDETDISYSHLKTRMAQMQYQSIFFGGIGRGVLLDLVRSRLTYSFSPKVTLQGLVQYNKRDDVLSTNLRFTWLSSANSGLYVVYNETDDRLGYPGRPRREFIVKYSRIFSI